MNGLIVLVISVSVCAVTLGLVYVAPRGHQMLVNCSSTRKRVSHQSQPSGRHNLSGSILSWTSRCENAEVRVFRNFCVDFVGHRAFFLSASRNRDDITSCWDYQRKVFRPTYVAASDLRVRSVISGNAILIDCWRSGGNPSHAMFGYRQVLATLSAADSVAWVVFRACNLHQNPLSQLIKLAAQDDILARFPTAKILDIPLHEGQEFDAICFERAIHSPQYGRFPETSARDSMYGQLQHFAALSSPRESCRRPMEPLRVGIFFRSTGSGTRRFCNEGDVARVATKLTNYSASYFTTSPSVPLSQQIARWNQFDLIISPVGSHNTLFYMSIRPAVLVIVQHAFWTIDMMNWATRSSRPCVMSQGHAVAQSDCSIHPLNDKLQQECATLPFFRNPAPPIKTCHLRALLFQNVLVNITNLEQTLSYAIDQIPRCPIPTGRNYSGVFKV